MGGVSFDMVAVKRGFDRNGIMRYLMMYQHGARVTVTRTQMNRGAIGLVFNTPRGSVAFDFSFEGEDQP